MKKTILTLILACFATWNIQARPLTLDTVAATTSGTISSNAKQVIMVFSSDYTGTVNGVSYTWAAGGSVNLAANQTGDVVNTISYTVTTGTLRILRLQ